MSSSTSTNTKSSVTSAPNMSSDQEFPGLAPPPTQLDLTPRIPTKPTPLAHIFRPKSKAKSKPVPKLAALPTLMAPREPRPSLCGNVACPVTGYHPARIYTCNDQRLPTYVKELEGRADKAKASGVKNEFNEAQKKLDRFFFWHSGFAYWPAEQEVVYGPFETSGAEEGWESYLEKQRT